MSISNKEPNLVRNYIFRTVYDVLLLIMPLITTPYISRVIGPYGVGVYSYTKSYMSYFTMLAMLGTSTYGSRVISRNRESKEKYSKAFWEIELLTVITTTIMLFFWLVLISFSKEYSIYFIALIPSLIGVVFNISWFFTGHEKINYTVTINTIFKIIGIICLFTLVKSKDDLFIYILINSTVEMLCNLSMWIFLPKMISKVNIKTLEIKTHFKETLVYFIPTIATSIYTVLDKILIGAITNNSYENGYYEQADKLLLVCKTIAFGSLNSIMSVRLSYLFFKNSINEIKDKIYKSMEFSFLLGYGSMFGLVAISKNLVPVFFGSGFEKVEYLLYFMSPLIIVVSISNVLGSQYYIPAGLRKQSAVYIIIGSCVNLIFNLILIPKLESIGAIISSIFAETVITILYVKNCNGYLLPNDIIKISTKKIIAGIIMFVVVYFIGTSNILNKIYILIIQILAGILIYALCLILLNDNIVVLIYKEIKKKILYRE